MPRPLSGGEVACGLFLITVFVLAIFAVVGTLMKRHLPVPAVHFITEADPDWVPRVPGSTATPIVAGQCGQYDGRRWHRVACPDKWDGGRT